MNKLISSIIGAGTGLAIFVAPVLAATTVVVTPTNQQGWVEADTRPGGDVNFVADATAPGGEGALQLTTDMTNTAKAQYLHAANTPITEVTELSYYTKQVSGPLHAAPSYQLPIDINGTTVGGFTTLVYEPYQNGVVTPGVWQAWDVDKGLFWSSRTIECSNGTLVAGAGGAPFYSLEQVQTLCPEAIAVGFGVNVGSYNPGYNVYTDLVNFNGTIYDFELVNTPSSKGQCKNGGYQNLTDSNGQSFKNQGQCVRYFNHQS